MRRSLLTPLAAAVLLGSLAVGCTPPPGELPDKADLIGCHRSTVPGVPDLEVIDNGLYPMGRYYLHPVVGPELCAGTNTAFQYYSVIAANQADALEKCAFQFVNPVVSPIGQDYEGPVRYLWHCTSSGR